MAPCHPQDRVAWRSLLKACPTPGYVRLSLYFPQGSTLGDGLILLVYKPGHLLPSACPLDEFISLQRQEYDLDYTPVSRVKDRARTPSKNFCKKDTIVSVAG